uniref:L3MBTL histone methyl-lysine binding protein 1b n=1 Tax=Oreochromis niloticus TaxID=8128 RepID=A0A669BPS6_ORENI
MTDTPPSDGPSQGAEFDISSAFDWQDGIATLRGSDIRFRVTEFKTYEIVTDLEVKGQEVEPNSETLDPPFFLLRLLVGPSVEVGSSANLGSNGELSRCRACGGRAPGDALLQGKFCCSACAQPSSGRSSPGEAREGQAVEGERLGKRVRKKRKIYMDSGDEEEENQEEPEEKAKATKGRRGAKIAKLVAAPPNKKRAWSWPSYLEEERAVAAPVKLFKEHQSFPQSRNSFKVGMKLEGLDPAHPSLFCVLSVAEIQGYRVRLHFDGYPECYDFWANADSWDLKPAGWCEKNGHKLLLPKGNKNTTNKHEIQGRIFIFYFFNKSVTPSGFRAGMKLEAVDRKNPALICVATIAAVVDNRLLIHFDNWDDTHDYWCDASSPYIHPVGYCEEAELTLTTPAECKEPKSFSWEKYLEETGTQAAPARAFKVRPLHGFQVGMKVEAVDKRNPMLIRVATIADTEDHRLKIHFDGWSSEYDYWVETDCPDLHPVGWCQKTGHPLQYPNGSSDLLTAPGQGCPTPGCNGVGHIRGPRYGTHYTQVSCPYSEVNLNKEGLLPDRLSGERPPALSGPHPRGRRPDPNANNTTQNSSTQDQPEGAEDAQNRFNPLTAPVPKYLKMHYVKEEIGDKAISFQQALHESVFSPGISASPPHRVALCWDKHCQLLPEVLGLTAKRVATWSAEEVAGFVKGLPGCKEHAATFKTEQIDGEAFLLLTQADIVKILSIKLGPALKIYNSILMLKNADEE